jgi:hypothetical protein
MVFLAGCSGDAGIDPLECVTESEEVAWDDAAFGGLSAAELVAGFDGAWAGDATEALTAATTPATFTLTADRAQPVRIARVVGGSEAEICESQLAVAVKAEVQTADGAVDAAFDATWASPLDGPYTPQRMTGTVDPRDLGGTADLGAYLDPGEEVTHARIVLSADGPALSGVIELNVVGEDEDGGWDRTAPMYSLSAERP